MAHRIEKVNNLIQELLAKAIVEEFACPNGVIVSLTRVEASPNLQECKVFISTLPNERLSDIIKALDQEVREFQDFLNKKLKMRPVPKIIFVPDILPEEAQQVETILESLKSGKKP